MDNRPITTTINNQGILTIGGIQVTDLVAEFGSPLWVIDQETLEKTCETYTGFFGKYYPNVQPLFASKALSTIPTTQLIADQGFGFDAVSGGEIFTIIKAGVHPKKIYFHGNNKSTEELELAISRDIGRIVVDNVYELNRVQSIAERHNRNVKILFRITPEVEAHTHEFIQTGQLDSKFGIQRSQLIEVINLAKSMNQIEVVGIHAHIGSQIFDVNPFGVTTERLFNLTLEIRERCGVVLSEINLGGGLGIKYMPSDDPAGYDEFAQHIGTTLKKLCDDHSFPYPKLLIEPGRSIVGTAGITLYTVGSIKSIPGIRTYVAVDGGMADNARPITYDAEYDAVIANKAATPAEYEYRIAGKFCESGDILIKNIRLPEVAIDDVLCVFGTGAYNYSMASNYNRFCKPAMVLVNKGKAQLIVKRETYEDLIRNDIPLKK